MRSQLSGNVIQVVDGTLLEFAECSVLAKPFIGQVPGVLGTLHHDLER